MLGMISGHTWMNAMSKAKIAITLEQETLAQVDRLIDMRMFANRSQAIQIAVEEKLRRLGKSRLAQECAKLDPAFEQALADEGLGQDVSAWPEY